MKRLLFLLLAFCLGVAFSSCRKSHYDLNEVNGIHAAGQWNLPVVKSEMSFGDLIQRFHIDTIITFDESGNLKFQYHFEKKKALDADRLLRFKNMDFFDSLSFENPYPFPIPVPIDTVITLSQTIDLQSQNISILSGELKSGLISLFLENNIADVHDVLVECDQIKDASGHGLSFHYHPEEGVQTIDVSGWHFDSEDFDEMVLTYTVDLTLTASSTTDYYLKTYLTVVDLAVREMRGRVNTYQVHQVFEKEFNFFPDNVIGTMCANSINLTVATRNSFGLSASLSCDTAWLWGPSVAPYSIFDTMPIQAHLPASPDYQVALCKSMKGRIATSCNNVYATTDIVINPDGSDDVVYVVDTCGIDVKVDAELPFAFNVEEFSYFDTLNVKFGQIESPEALKSLALDFAFENTIPLNIKVCTYFFDYDTMQITDTLFVNQFLPACFDGQPTQETFSVKVDRARLQNVFQSDAILLYVDVDTDARDVVLQMQQALRLLVKTSLDYDATFQFENPKP